MRVKRKAAGPARLRAAFPSLQEAERLVLLLTDLLAIALTCKRFLDALLLARLQIEGMTLHFLDDVFSLNLALKPAQCIFERFALLHSDLCQWKYTSKPCH